MALTIERARTLMESFPQCRLLVVGDLILDRYVHGKVERISPEAPVPVVHVESETSVPGGACNVGLNIQALGGQSLLCGVAGTCARGDELMHKLDQAGVDTRLVLRHQGIATSVKTRIVADRQQMLRVDREVTDVSEWVSSDAFLSGLASGLPETNGVILEDYGKGVLQQTVVSKVLEMCRPGEIPVGYDPKENHELDVRGITFATPNRREAFAVTGHRDRAPARDPLQDTALNEVAEALVRLWEPEHLMITLGPQGILLKEQNQRARHLRTRAREVFDVSGAGDTVIATAMLALTAGATFVEAVELANVAAGLVVAKLGTATTTPEEILGALELQP